MSWLFACIKPSVREEGGPGRRSGHQDSSNENRWNHRHSNRIVNYVELLRHLDEPLGLVVRGGGDQPVYIEALRPGGVAQKSDALQVNDRIQAINGVATDRLTHSEVLSLLKSAGTVINLEVSYETLSNYDESRDDVQIKTMAVQLFREREGFGLTIRGGREENRPITVAHIVEHSMVYRAGIVKVGDRVLQINGCNMENCSQFDALTILRGASEMVTMMIEYEVELQDEKLRNATDPLLVKILKPPSSTFGISLSGASSPGSPIWITEVKQGSIADRCGAVHVGDQLLSINNHMLGMCSVQDATHLIISSDIHMELQIMPAHNFTSRPGFGNCLTADMVVLCEMGSTQPSSSMRTSTASLVSSKFPGITSHPETVSVTIDSDDVGFGINLRGGATDHHNRPIIIAEVIPDGPAFRLGQLKAGDKVLMINGVSLEGVTLHTAIKLANEMKECISMTVEFEVEDTVVPKAGCLDIELIKIGMSLGITINGAQTPGAPVWISDMKKGGAAYRTGLIKAGDVIIAINGQSCDYVTLDEAVSMLKKTGEIVYLRIKKESNSIVPLENNDTVTYSVQLNRDNQELGIILGLSPTGEFMIKALMDGVARRTGTVKIGSYILAINGDNLAGRTITQVEEMLENCGNSVTLKIKKNIKQTKPRSKQPSPIGREGGRRDSSHNGKLKMSFGLPLGAPGIPTLESYSQGYSFLNSINDDGDDDINITEKSYKSTTLPTVKKSDLTTDTDTTRGSFTEDEMSSLDDEGMEQQSRTGRMLSKDDNKLYRSFPHNKTSRVSQIPIARATSLSRRRQLEDMEDTNSNEIKQIRSTLIESDKYLNRICKIVEQPSSSDPDSDHEPAYKGRHRRYASNKFTQCIKQRVRLVKSDYNPDFGFSISDSAYDPGIYIHQVKPGSPAEANGLQPYDRILKINDCPVHQQDCSGILPLLRMRGNEVKLLISRNLQASNGHHSMQQTEEI